MGKKKEQKKKREGNRIYCIVQKNKDIVFFLTLREA